MTNFKLATSFAALSEACLMARKGVPNVTPSRFIELETAYQKAVGDELGLKRYAEADELCRIIEAGGADLAAPSLAALATEWGLAQASLARSFIEHQAGMAYRFSIAGDRRDSLAKGCALLGRAAGNAERKRHPRAWGETAKYLAQCYRDLAAYESPIELERSRNRSEGLLQEAHDAFVKLGVPGAFHRASVLLTMGNLACERSQWKRGQRLFAAALAVIEDRVSKLGWADLTMGNPQALFASVVSSAAIPLIRDGVDADFHRARSELEEALRKVEHPRLRFRLVQVRSLQQDVDQASRDALATLDVVTSLAERDLEEVASLLSGGQLTPPVEAFFRDIIRRLTDARANQRARHSRDHTAQRIQHFARHWAKLVLPADAATAWCIIEANASLRMQESLPAHRWSPTDANLAEAAREWSTAAELAKVFEGWAALVARTPTELRRHVLTNIGRQLDPTTLDGIEITDASQAISVDRFWNEYQRLDPKLDPEEALARHAEVLHSESQTKRRQLELDVGFVQAQQVIEPMEEAELRALLLEVRGTAVLRVEYVDEQLLAFYGDVDPGGAARILSYSVPFPARILELIDPREIWEHGRLSVDALEAIAGIDLTAGIPPDGPRRLFLLQCGPINLLPSLAVGPAGRTLIDRFDAIQNLWTFASLRVRPAQPAQMRGGQVQVYAGRGHPFADEKSTRLHAIAASLDADDGTLRFSSDASLGDVVRAWAHAKVISFYGHGNHVLMGRRAKYPGPQLQLGTGDVLRMASLQDATYGLDRVELWACRSGLDFPWDPMFPVHEGFGFDYELISSGVRTTIGTLWSVDELTTSLVVLRYRKALREGRDPAAALVEAQRWWRDVAQPRFVADEDFTAVTIGLWRSVLAGQAAPDEASVRAWLTATSRDPDRRAALIESLRSPIAHAAYRFSGLQHTPAERLEAQAAPPRPAPQRGIVRLTIGELRVQPIPRPPPFATEVGGFIDDRTNWIGVVTKDKVDGDFTFIVLEIEDGEYRMLHMEDSYEDEAAAFRDLERFLTEGFSGALTQIHFAALS